MAESDLVPGVAEAFEDLSVTLNNLARFPDALDEDDEQVTADAYVTLSNHGCRIHALSNKDLVTLVASVDARSIVDALDVDEPVAGRPKTTVCDVTTALVVFHEYLMWGADDFHANNIVDSIFATALAFSSTYLE